MNWMNDDEGTFEAAVAGNACYICGSVVHVPDRNGVCPREAEWEQAQDQIEKASTPDPDAPPCASCGGGLAHFPECPEIAR